MVDTALPTGDSGTRSRSQWTVRLVIAALLGVAAAAAVAGAGLSGGFAGTALTIAVAAPLVVVGLRSPLWAVILLLVTLLMRLALPSVGADPFLAAFALLVVSFGAWWAANRRHRPKLGGIEIAMLLYVAWNVFSILGSHELPALVDPELTDQLSLWRYLLIGTVIPFVVYFVARSAITTLAAVRTLLVASLAFASYSAAVSIMQFTGPRALVWPRYVVDAPNYTERANGLLNQPGANGVVLIIGYAVAVLLASTLPHPRWRRLLLWAIAAACTYAIYLTHTRAVYFGFVVVVVIGATMAKGIRRPYLVTLGLLAAGVAANWQSFSSSDREQGGIASTNEVFDRLNADATALWAFAEKPWFGWGLGRFLAVNTFHHQRASEDVPWIRGLGVASHFNELGILAELGIVGLLMWLAVLGLIFGALVRGIRAMPTEGLLGRPLVLTALMGLTALTILGLFADLRLLDYPNALAFGLVGMAVGVIDRCRGTTEQQYVRIPRARF
jgi:O-antigen ligase